MEDLVFFIEYHHWAQNKILQQVSGVAKKPTAAIMDC